MVLVDSGGGTGCRVNLGNAPQISKRRWEKRAFSLINKFPCSEGSITRLDAPHWAAPGCMTAKCHPPLGLGHLVIPVE